MKEIFLSNNYLDQFLFNVARLPLPDLFLIFLSENKNRLRTVISKSRAGQGLPMLR